MFDDFTDHVLYISDPGECYDLTVSLNTTAMKLQLSLKDILLELDRSTKLEIIFVVDVLACNTERNIGHFIRRDSHLL